MIMFSFIIQHLGTMQVYSCKRLTISQNLLPIKYVHHDGQPTPYSLVHFLGNKLLPKSSGIYCCANLPSQLPCISKLELQNPSRIYWIVYTTHLFGRQKTFRKRKEKNKKKRGGGRAGEKTGLTSLHVLHAVERHIGAAVFMHFYLGVNPIKHNGLDFRVIGRPDVPRHI